MLLTLIAKCCKWINELRFVFLQSYGCKFESLIWTHKIAAENTFILLNVYFFSLQKNQNMMQYLRKRHLVNWIQRTFPGKKKCIKVQKNSIKYNFCTVLIYYFKSITLHKKFTINKEKVHTNNRMHYRFHCQLNMKIEIMNEHFEKLCSFERFVQ